MKHLIRFSLFEEVNPKDIALIESRLDNYFTIAFEFEIETNDISNALMDFEMIDEDSIDDIESVIIKDMKIRKNSEKELVSDLLLELLDAVENYSIDITSFESLFAINKYDTQREKDIVNHLKNSIKAYIYEENYDFLKEMVRTHMPNFIEKWNQKIEFIGDATLNRGIEIKPKTYLSSLSESIEMIEDFYNDLESQNYWHFSERTGLHINIGTKDRVNWNPLKGLLLLSDFSENDVPYTFKDMTWRMNNKFCGSLMPYLNNLKKKEKAFVKSLNIKNLSKTEQLLNQFLIKKVNEIGFKNLGFNISKISNPIMTEKWLGNTAQLGEKSSKPDYVEFRYAGGEIPKDVLIEKLKYFCFIVYAMTNQEYKRREYIKKLYKFLDEL